MNPQAFNLTMEQQFKFTTIKKELHKLTPDQKNDYILSLVEHVMIKDNVIKDLIRKQL